MIDTGSTNDSSSSSGVPASPQGLPCCCCPLHGGRKGNKTMDLLCWVAVGVVTYMWARTTKLDTARPLEMLGFFALAILPGSVLTSLGTTAIDRLVPARGGK